jgi:hypothetical protein
MASNVLNTRTKITQVMNAQAVGITTVNGTVLDMEGYEGVEFVALAGVITDGNFVLKAQDGALANLADAADLAGTATQLNNGQNNTEAVLDVHRPQKRYIRPVVVRGGATGAVINGIVAIQYGPKNLPVADDATTVPISKTVISPANGAA